MMPVILGFAGRIASGKSTLSQCVAEALNWPWVSFGEYVRVEAQRRGRDLSRASLQEVGDLLIVAGWEPFCRAVLAQAHWCPEQPLVVDGIRHVEGLQMLHDLVSPQLVLLVFIELSETTRAVRLNERGLVADEQRQCEGHTSEVQVRTSLPQVADLIVDGTQSIADLTNDIVNWLRHRTK